MSRAQCYYDILGISETATTEEVKQAYKKMALVWHPDKNQANQEEAHAKFQIILKAYETLSDNREREWYDRHKDQILSDGNKEDACINLFQYFSSSCYANFDDSEDGFYTIYRNVFEQIKQEEEQAVQLASKYTKTKSKAGRSGKSDVDSCLFPTFGTSDSSYEDVVRPFYAFWSGFCTNLTFDHLDKWNTTEAENRRILRAMDKENKKLKDAAKKERNTNVRNLVEFIKRRDKRLKAHKMLVEQQNEYNRQKTAEKQRQQREKTLKNTANYQPTSYFEMDDVEAQLQLLEEEYNDLTKSGKRGRRKQFIEHLEESDGDDNVDAKDEDADVNVRTDSSHPQNQNASNECDKNPAADNLMVSDEEEEDNEEEEDEVESFFCPACNKDFRTINAFENHEASKKHKQKVKKLTDLLKADESKLNK